MQEQNTNRKGILLIELSDSEEEDEATGIKKKALPKLTRNRKGRLCTIFSSLEKPQRNQDIKDNKGQLEPAEKSPSLNEACDCDAKCKSDEVKQWDDIWKESLPEKMADWTLVAGEDNEAERFHIVNSIINLRCPVLAEELKQYSPDVKEIPIENAVGFRNFWSYIHTNEMEMDAIDDNELLTLLDYVVPYKLDGLLPECVAVLKNRMNFENVIQIHEKAVCHRLEELEDLSFKFMLEYGYEVLKTDTFLSMCSSTLIMRLIESDNLNCSELEIFLAAVRWATASTASEGNNTPTEPAQLRAAVNQLIPYIRFPLLTSAELADFIIPYKILTSDEIIELYNCICSQYDKKAETSFNCQPRVYQCRVEPADGGIENFARTPQILNIWSLNESGNVNFESHRNTSNAVNLRQDAQTQTPSLFESRRSSSSSDAEYICGLQTSDPLSTTRRDLNALHSPPSTSFPVSTPTGYFAELSTSIHKIKNTASKHKPLQTSESEPSIDMLLLNKQIKEQQPKVISSSESSSDESDELDPVHNKTDCNIGPWDDYVNGWTRTKGLKRILEIKLDNVLTAFGESNTLELLKEQICIPSLREVYFDLTDNELAGNFREYVHVFDIRKIIFFTNKSSSNNWKLDELWDMGIRTTIIVNAVKLFEMNKDQELTISFGNDSYTIMSGLKKSHKLLKLNLIKTDVPNVNTFPARQLQTVLFYNVLAHWETSIGQFAQKCVNLEEFSCYAVRPQKQVTKLLLDLAKNFVSGNLLKRLAICDARLAVTASKKCIKEGLKELYLDVCFWPPDFEDKIHLIFPNLQKVSLRQRKKATATAAVTFTMLSNLIQINTIEWIRIWGMSWKKTSNIVASSSIRDVRTSSLRISDEKLNHCKTVMESCGLKDVTHFLLEKISNNEWKGTNYDQEFQENNDAFYNQLNFEHFQLKNVFKDYQTFQTN